MSAPALWSAGSYACAPAGLWPEQLSLSVQGGEATWRGPSGSAAVHLAPGLTRRADGGDIRGQLEALGDPAGRVAAQQRDGLSGEVLLPDPALAGLLLAPTDPGLVREGVERYNAWIHGFCSADPERLVPVALIPSTGLDDALSALRDAAAKGFRSVCLFDPPAGPGTAPGGDAEEFWELAGSRIVVAIGSSFGGESPTLPREVGSGKPPEYAGFLSRLAFSGVPDRIALRLLVTGVGAGWLPYVLEAADTNYVRAASSRTVSLGDESALPSEYIRRFLWTTFHSDRFAVLSRQFLGEHHLVWSAELPAADSDWPNDETQAAHVCSGLPTPSIRRLTSENCTRLFGLPGSESFNDEELENFAKGSVV